MSIRVPPPDAPAGIDRRDALRRCVVASGMLGGGWAHAAATRTLRIGCTLDHSSVEKPNGSGLHLGASAFFDAVNKSGGINGWRIELVLADDQFKPDLAKANAEAFAADRSVVAMIHPLGTRQTAAVMDAVHDMAIVG